MSDLFRSDNVVVRSVPASDLSRWVVTFDNYGIGPGFERPGFSQDYLQRAGISAIHVMGVGGDWYQYPEMAAAMKAVGLATADADRVVTYGCSMGGYAALRFAEAAGAHAVLALSPQYSINPETAPFEGRWIQESRNIQWIPEIEKPLNISCPAIIAYDPTDIDRRHAHLFAQEAAVEHLRVPYGGHPVSTFLAEAGLLKPLLDDVISGRLDAASFQRAIRKARTTNATYFSQLADRQPAHRPDLALALAKRALERSPDSVIALGSYASKLTKLGRHEEAVRLHVRAVDLSQRDHNALVHYANALVAADCIDEATVIADEVIKKVPYIALLREWQATIFEKNGDWEQALASIGEAIRLDPDNPVLQVYKKKYTAKIERLRSSKVKRFIKNKVKRLLDRAD